MRQIRSERTRRQAFTTLELLVVIGILAMLFALTAAAALRMYGKGPETLCRSEIGALSTAIGTFKQEFGVDYLPSRFVLYGNLARYGSLSATGGTSAQLEKDSLAFLQRMFGQRIGIIPNTNPPRRQPLHWLPGNPNVATVLTGDQCLVFFLGGIPNSGGTAGCQGFGSNPSDPTDLSTATGGTRRGPFYPEFKANRLITKANGFYNYQDPFLKKQHYAYFSAYKAMNGYNRYGASDCAGLSPYYQSTTAAGNPPVPAANSTTIYLNPTSFQLISAGPDGVFGPGGHWNPASGYSLPPVVVNGSGGDDMSNFSRTMLGQPQS